MSDIVLRTLEAERERASKDINKRVREAIELLLAQGRTPSFYAVAETARVARSTLYRRADLKELVVQARANSSPEAKRLAAISEMQADGLLGETDLLAKKLGQLRKELSQLSAECDALMSAMAVANRRAKTIASAQDPQVEYACFGISEWLAA